MGWSIERPILQAWAPIPATLAPSAGSDPVKRLAGQDGGPDLREDGLGAAELLRLLAASAGLARGEQRVVRVHGPQLVVADTVLLGSRNGAAWENFAVAVFSAPPAN